MDGSVQMPADGRQRADAGRRMTAGRCRQTAGRKQLTDDNSDGTDVGGIDRWKHLACDNKKLKITICQLFQKIQG
jgi:hypothetical protein